MLVFKCKMCGGTLEINAGETVATCEYCGTKQTLPKLDDEKKANLIDRANHFRRNNDFDKAMGIYEAILNEDAEDAESYWSIVLCRYGIEYVEDPSTHKRVPTVNRAQFTSVFDDEDYKSAIKYADIYQKDLYEQEAKTINEIQKGILAISQKEEPFDVFICYKETDNKGRRTQDSVLATELYHELTKEGFKVFFSRITLEDKLGTAYEPYIFAALHSAKVMVVLGTKPEHFNAVWVKNEWSRYLSLIKNGANKILIPAYRDMDPYDLPEEFSHLQAQDMSKLGFMQDLVRGIKKLVSVDRASSNKEIVTVQNVASGNASALVKRGFLALEDGEWEKADDFFEQALNQNAEDAQAYLGKMMAELKISKSEELAKCKESFESRNNYQKAIRFADEALKKTLENYVLTISERNELERVSGIYASAMQKMNTATNEERFLAAATEFESIPGYKNSKELAEQCRQKAEVETKEAILRNADSLLSDSRWWIGKETDLKSYEEAISQLETISGYKDADSKMEACRRKLEEIKIQQENEREERERQAETKRAEKEKRSKRNMKIVMIASPIVVTGLIIFFIISQMVIPELKYREALGLLEEGRYEESFSVLAELGDYKDSKVFIKNYYNYYQQFENLISAYGFYTVGLKSDGTVVAVGSNTFGTCNVEEWADIVAISARWSHTVGLKSDGTVVAAGSNTVDECNVGKWADIIAISAGRSHTVGLKSDGTVVAVGSNTDHECNVGKWADIIAISAGEYHTVGLKSDGTVVAVGSNRFGQCNVEKWTDIVAISAGSGYTVGLKSDGTVVAVGYNTDDECNVEEWTDIVAISAGNSHTVGLKYDGTVVAVGSNTDDECNVEEWTDIVAVSAGSSHTVGLKSDGTVVTVGSNRFGQCNVEEWSLF